MVDQNKKYSQNIETNFNFQSHHSVSSLKSCEKGEGKSERKREEGK